MSIYTSYNIYTPAGFYYKCEQFKRYENYRLFLDLCLNTNKYKSKQSYEKSANVFIIFIFGIFINICLVNRALI